VAELVDDRIRAYNFVLDIGGVQSGYFTEVTGLSVDIEVIPYREGGAAPAERKFPGRVSYGPVRARWGLTQSTDLWDWLMATARGELLLKDISIILLPPNGDPSAEEARWNLTKTWVSNWCGAKLNSLGNEIAIETITFVHEGLDRA